MANLVLCGFEWGTVYEADTWEYAVADTKSIKTDVVNSGNYSCFISVYDHIGFAFPSSSEVFIQAAVNFDVQITGEGRECFVWKGNQGSTELGSVYTNDISQVVVRSGGVERIISDSIQLATWYILEVHIITGTNGLIEFKIDGNLVGTYSGNTGSVNPDFVDFCSFWGMYIDDIVIDDADWCGCQKIVLLRPDATGDMTQWDPTHDYSNYEHVNDVPADYTDYVTTDTKRRTDLYEIASLPTEAFEIGTLRSQAWCEKDSGSIVNNALLAFTLKTGDIAVTATELALNGTFDTGDLTGWHQTGSTDNISVYSHQDFLDGGFARDVYSGYSLACSPSSSLSGLSLLIYTDIDSYYCIRFYCANSMPDGPQGSNSLSVYWASEALQTATDTASQDYTQYQYFALATTTMTFVQFEALNSTGTFFLDSISVQLAPIYTSTVQDVYLHWQLASYAWSLVNPQTSWYYSPADVNQLQIGYQSK